MKPQDWTSDDALKLREFLATASGQKLSLAIAENRPRLDGSTIETTALSAKFGAGWDSYGRTVSALAQLEGYEQPKSDFVDVS